MRVLGLVLFLGLVACVWGGIPSTCTAPFTGNPTNLEDIMTFNNNGSALNSIVFFQGLAGDNDISHRGIIYDDNTNHIYWANHRISQDFGVFYDYNLNTENLVTYTNVGCPDAQVMAADGTIYSLSHCGLGGSTPNRYIAQRTLPFQNNDLGTVAFDEYKPGQKFLEPKDIAIRADGTLYITDIASITIFGTNPQPRPNYQGLYRWFPPPRDEVQLLATFTSPTAVCFSPNQKYLYVADGTDNIIYRYDVNKDGSLGAVSLFADLSPPNENGPTAMVTDIQGTVYVASIGIGGDLFAIREDGTKLYKSNQGNIPVSDGILNTIGSFAWGTYQSMDVLFTTTITNGLAYIPTCVAGHPQDGTCVATQPPGSAPVPCWGPITSNDGVCCHSDGTCTIETSATCSGSSVFVPGEQECLPGRCASTRGTCCVGANFGTCSVVGGFDFCNGQWKGEGSGCELCSGACCTGGSCSIVTGGNCASTYLGDGSDCVGCVTGGCCDLVSAGMCESDIAAGLCLPPAVYRGDGDTCPAICPPSSSYTNLGACCIGNTCVLSNGAGECSGNFQGVGTDCNPTGNGNTVCFIMGDGIGDGGNDGGSNDGSNVGSSPSDEEGAASTLHFL